jgi:uncharacterized repeat protein (TIGR01451 family)
MTQYTDSFATVTVCSYDPNDKQAYPQGVGPQNMIPTDTPMEFMINFQNTGTDTAFNIVIADTLDPDLDWNSFEIVAHSHEVYAQMDQNGVVTFTFENIFLPDSNVDEPGSHGFVAYRLNVDSFLPDPTEITNTAYIYFDYNAPIVTNTTLTTLSDQAIPTGAFAANDLTVCPGNCINFTDQSAFATSYQWTFPGGNPSTSTDQNPANICYSTGGDYDVQLIVTNSVGSDTVVYTNYIHVYNVPLLNIVQSGDTLFSVQGFASYVWYYNGNIISGATDYYHVATQNGDYNVVAFDSNGCDVEAALYNVLTAVTSIHVDELQLFPNPVKDVLSINGLKKGQVRIINVLGEIVNEIRCDSGEPVQKIDLSGLNSGTYTVEILTDGAVLHRQIVKQ